MPAACIYQLQLCSPHTGSVVFSGQELVHQHQSRGRELSVLREPHFRAGGGHNRLGLLTQPTQSHDCWSKPSHLQHKSQDTAVSQTTLSFHASLYYVCAHLRLIKVLITHELNMIWRCDLDQLTSLAKSHKNLGAHGCKPWVTNLSITPNTIRHTKNKYYLLCHFTGLEQGSPSKTSKCWSTQQTSCHT